MITRRDVLAGGAALAGSLLLAACSGSGGGTLPNVAAGQGDVNPRPREAVRDGGVLRWPMDNMPDNFNYNQYAGTSEPTSDVTGALLPTLFLGTADGGLRLNSDYLVSAELTGTAPQTVTYRIHPKAAWSDGTPMNWRDFEAAWRAQNGTNPAFQIAGKSGYEDIASVRRGADDKEAVVTFARPVGEWRMLFSPLYPASTNSDPATFNTGWVNKIPVTGGPFAVESIDLVGKTVTLRRDSRWWGQPAKLDKIVFRVFERAALADALANNELDFYRIGSSVDLFRRAQAVPGVAVRLSPDRRYNHLTFNGAPGATLSDAGLRRAVAKGIDRAAITRRLTGQIAPRLGPMGNHIYAYGSVEYRDNSGELPYDPAAASRELDALGWVRQGTGPRAKDGKPLVLRLVEGAPNPISELIDRTVLDQLAQIGVTVVINPVPIAQLSQEYRRGNFDLAGFGWENTSTPFSSSVGIYAEPKGDDVQQNYGRVYNPEISALFAQGLRELDDAKRVEIGNRIDRLIWQEVHHLPLNPGTGAFAVRANLANFGAKGFADFDYVNAGFEK